jgi:hypothetical protein
MLISFQFHRSKRQLNTLIRGKFHDCKVSGDIYNVLHKKKSIGQHPIHQQLKIQRSPLKLGYLIKILNIRGLHVEKIRITSEYP